MPTTPAFPDVSTDHQLGRNRVVGVGELPDLRAVLEMGCGASRQERRLDHPPGTDARFRRNQIVAAAVAVQDQFSRGMLHIEAEGLIIRGGPVGDSAPPCGAVVFRHEEDGPSRVAAWKAGQRARPLQHVIDSIEADGLKPRGSQSCASLRVADGDDIVAISGKIRPRRDRVARGGDALRRIQMQDETVRDERASGV